VAQPDVGAGSVNTAHQGGVILGGGMHMSIFCLVHGSTQSPKGWELLVTEIKVRAMSAFAPICRPIRPIKPQLRMPSAILARFCKNQRLDRRGHSASDFPALIPEIRGSARLVYLAAAIPMPVRVSCLSSKRIRGCIGPILLEKIPRDEALACQYLFHDCPPNMCDGRCQPCVSCSRRRPLSKGTPASGPTAVFVHFL